MENKTDRTRSNLYVVRCFGSGLFGFALNGWDIGILEAFAEEFRGAE